MKTSLWRTVIIFGILFGKLPCKFCKLEIRLTKIPCVHEVRDHLPTSALCELKNLRSGRDLRNSVSHYTIYNRIFLLTFILSLSLLLLVSVCIVFRVLVFQGKRFLMMRIPHLFNYNYCNVFRRRTPKINTILRWFSTKVELTSVRYKDHVTRGNFATLEDRDFLFFEGILGKTRMSRDPTDLEAHNVDWIKIVRGASQLLLKPKTTEEVSAILKYCNDRCLAICPQGGNTGLVGGSVPVYDEIVLNTSLMNQIISLDEWSGVMVCQSGCVLEALSLYLNDRGLIMPLDLGAKGSCHIGGNVSTNAGGLRLLRYGSLHSTVLGVEAVLADGTVMNCLSTMKKDNTGYDLKHLFIGSEGTLGLVTKVSIQCPIKPNAINLAFLGMKTFENVLQTFKAARQDLGEILSSCEYIDGESMRCVEQNLKLKKPTAEFPFYMVIECSGSNATHDEEKLNAFLEDLMSKRIVSDGTVAADSNQMLALWGLRERIAEALICDGYTYKYDLSIPLTMFDTLVQDMRKQLGGDAIRCCGYGHLGDSNIHLNITTPEYNPAVTSKIEPFVYEWVSKHNGSVSAEHGLGFKKRDFISFSKSQESISMMKQLKSLFDPKGILNPYKVLPA